MSDLVTAYQQVSDRLDSSTTLTPWQQKQTELRQNVEQLDGMIQSYQEINELVSQLPQKVEHQVLLPLGGSQKVLIRGVVSDTNRILSQLGETVFVARTAANTKANLDARLQMATSIKADFTKQLDELQKREEFAAAGIAEIKAPEPKQTDIPQEHDGPGVIRKTPEGFLEIVESIPLEGSRPALVARPLIQEICTSTSPSPSEAPRAAPKRSRFAEEFMSKK
eukprot:Protomagalhaensia_sp_Gyna_25__5599@NODE_773_length_2646_cov_832_530495_g606_i0_p2_GENE_NODE_773_length_2646_cov_832_530495_g606_i0NODE_773_length_2646_cov_832_530495_g606_i0_p2_ORF_typecomplete_len223_score30_84Prefoldin/PF02996_17/3_3e14DUF4763/PF15960_5/0_0029Prefoldin_2/PF01920_20/0_019Snapin_Pallidin/PF14712_6/0_092Snapin_Pallidin/PF14712_6/3e03DUF1664/PF07889_12/0_16DUF1664/PF07889_12/2_4e02BLOC1_2/PF10046_9/0_42BLOC1_2/PF10046_9/1_1e03KELK/PF15796_5/0_71KELK/PF15796_5/7_3e02NPV_P10/PF05531